LLKGGIEVTNSSATNLTGEGWKSVSGRSLSLVTWSIDNYVLGRMTNLSGTDLNAVSWRPVRPRLMDKLSNKANAQVT